MVIIVGVPHVNHKHDGLQCPNMMSCLYTVEQKQQIKGYITGSCIYVICYHDCYILYQFQHFQMRHSCFVQYLLSHMS
jgi:hypothetical protein